MNDIFDCFDDFFVDFDCCCLFGGFVVFGVGVVFVGCEIIVGNVLCLVVDLCIDEVLC